MKKAIFLVSFFMAFMAHAQAMELIQLTASLLDVDDRPVGNSTPKSPTEPPTVYIEDYTLSFEVGHPEYVLNIKDEDGEVVYTTVVYSTQTEVVLPSTLSGDYEIELIMGNWLFTGYINL